MSSINNISRFILAIVSGFLALLQLGIMMNTHSIRVLRLTLLVIYMFLLLYAINPQVLDVIKKAVKGSK